MKIAEIEAKIEQGDCSEEIMELFRTALKRVPKSGRCQHCYITAAKMPLCDHRQAISLIEYGISEHCSNWTDRMRSFHNLANIYEAIGDYRSAQKSYKQALLSIEEDKRSKYVPEYAAHMMRTEMHISDFEYTEDLNRFYNTAIQADAFSQSFQKKMFYRFLAEIIIFRNHGDIEKAKKSYDSANEMLKPGFVGPLTNLLKRKISLKTPARQKKQKHFWKEPNSISNLQPIIKCTPCHLPAGGFYLAFISLCSPPRFPILKLQESVETQALLWYNGIKEGL